MKCVVARVQYDGKILYAHFVFLFVCFFQKKTFLMTLFIFLFLYVQM